MIVNASYHINFYTSKGMTAKDYHHGGLQQQQGIIITMNNKADNKININNSNNTNGNVNNNEK